MKLVAALLCICISVDLSAQIAARGFTAKNGEFIGFQEYRPTDYASSPAAHPLIIFLHGVGEKGNGKSQLRDVWCCGLPSYIKRGIPMRFTWNGKTESFVVLIPQLNPKYNLWQSFYINELIKYATENLRINPNRIFVTGLSLGGGGTWRYASESVSNARRLAGIVPVVGPCQMSNGCNIARANLPVLAVHALDDKKASPACTTNAIKEINSCGATVLPNLIMYPTGGHAVWLKRAYSVDHEYQNPNVYEWMLAQDKSLHPNKKPRARAGGDQSVADGATSTLNGTESSDPDGKILRYMWRKISGPAGGNISNAIAAATKITSLNTGTYKYELKVVDDRAEWSTDTIMVKVGNGGPLRNAAPNADAGDNQAIVLPVSSAILDGELSYDDDGTISNYLWTYENGPQGANIENINAAKTTVNGLVTGKYQFRLTVTDNKGARGQDVVTIQVHEEGTTPPPPDEDNPPPEPRAGIRNELPIAKAGDDRTILSSDDFFTLDGTNSYDDDGKIEMYQWRKISGPEMASIENATAALTKVRGAQSATYEFELMVRDNGLATALDTVTIAFEFAPKEADAYVYPNPVKNNLNLRLRGTIQGRFEIAIIDVNGRKMFEKSLLKNSYSIDESLPTLTLNSGVYFLQVTGKQKTQVIKFVKGR